MLPFRVLVACIVLSALSCGNGATGHEEELREVLDLSGSADAMKRGLLALDQKYPDTVEIKINLGILLLSLDEVEDAGIYLERAYALRKKPLPGEQEYLLLSGIADCALKNGDHDRARVFAEKALALGGEDRLGNRLVIARCDYFEGRYADSYEAYGRVWERDRRFMSKEDHEILTALAVSAAHWDRALNVLYASMHAFGYEHGLGARASALLEKAGELDAGILAAFTDLRYSQFRGTFSREAIGGAIEALRSALTSGSENGSYREEKTTTAIESILADRWEDAWPLLEEAARRAESGGPLTRFWLDVVRLESGDGTVLARYRDSEPVFRFHPEYYYRLWRALRRHEPGYSFGTARPVLEKCACLSRGTEFGSETLREIGRLIGLPAGQAERLLVDYEIAEYAVRFRSTGELQLLQPIIDLLALDDNPYTDSAAAVLGDLSCTYPSVREHLSAVRSGGPEKLRLRLNNLLD